jgi:hypothetical protein
MAGAEGTIALTSLPEINGPFGLMTDFTQV